MWRHSQTTLRNLLFSLSWWELLVLVSKEQTRKLVNPTKLRLGLLLGKRSVILRHKKPDSCSFRRVVEELRLPARPLPPANAWWNGKGCPGDQLQEESKTAKRERERASLVQYFFGIFSSKTDKNKTTTTHTHTHNCHVKVCMHECDGVGAQLTVIR